MMYTCMYTHIQSHRQGKIGSSMCTKISLKQVKILLCLSVFHSAVLGTASPLRPAYLPRHLSYFPESTEIASLSPRPPYSRLSPPTQSSEESLCFYFFSLQKWDNTAATTNNHKKKKKKSVVTFEALIRVLNTPYILLPKHLNCTVAQALVHV